MKYNPTRDETGRWIVKTNTRNKQPFGFVFDNAEDAMDCAATLTVQYHLNQAQKALKQVRPDTQQTLDIGRNVKETQMTYQKHYAMRKDYNPNNPMAWSD